ncbi:MAG: hypothetical protein GWN54_13980, partial [Gammaproteobacteria bacterium]|nr:hypothetical protein [Gammaproteobacteria bacterium]
MIDAALKRTVLAPAAMLLLAGCATTDDYPDVTEHGLVRLESTRAQAVYAVPDADL